MGILDSFAEDWIQYQEDEKTRKDALPKTTEEADDMFVEGYGDKIHEHCYAIREIIEQFQMNKYGNCGDTFSKSNLAERILEDTISIQAHIVAGKVDDEE